MTDLLAYNAEAAAWVDRTRTAHSGNRAFGKVVGAVVWTDELGVDGKPLVPADPVVLVEDINANGWPLYAGHDPGSPAGAVLAAEVFTSLAGTRFVAAVLGLYDAGSPLRFCDLGLDTTPAVSSPTHLDVPYGDFWLDFASDPREVEPEWVESVLRDAPLRVERTELSHNAAEPLGELIRVGLVYATLVWNPFTTSVGTEAGKRAVAGIHRWLRTLWDKLVERKNPVVEIQSRQDGCLVSFLFRGKDVRSNYAAHDALPIAAAQAAKLIAGMKSRGVPARSVTYEFELESAKWFPSYAKLHDHRLVSDRNVLIALEQSPAELSLGISRGKEKPRLPE